MLHPIVNAIFMLVLATVGVGITFLVYISFDKIVDALWRLRR